MAADGGGNALRGEVTFEDGQGVTRTLRLDINAICTLEGETTLMIADIMPRVAIGNVSVLRSAFRVGLSRMGQQITAEQAGKLIEEIGYKRAQALVQTAFERTFPPPSEDEGDPPLGEVGTGASI